MGIRAARDRNRSEHTQGLAADRVKVRELHERVVVEINSPTMSRLDQFGTEFHLCIGVYRELVKNA